MVLTAEARAALPLSTASLLQLGHWKGTVSPNLRNNASMCLVLFLLGGVWLYLRNYLYGRAIGFSVQGFSLISVSLCLL